MATFKQYETEKGKFWKYRAYLGTDETTGKDKRVEKRGFKTKKEAQLSLSRLQLDYDKNGSVNNTKYTYNDMYLLWLEQYKNTVKESTLAKTQRTFKNHILPFFGQYRIDKIKPTYCQKAVNLWHEKKLVKYKIMMNYTSKVFAYAISLNLLTDNPTKRITIPKVIEDVTEDVLKNFYTKEELKLFFDCIEKENIYRDLTLFRVLAFTGARKGEILSLTWQDINFKDNTIRINKALAQGLNNKLIIQTPKTKTSVRTISIDPKTTEILKEWRKKQKEFYFM
ncbi:Integrase [Brachybacterium faecium]|nr:Integrase [Brachybacterium faecium]